jgi:hypothetical protein
MGLTNRGDFDKAAEARARPNAVDESGKPAFGRPFTSQTGAAIGRQKGTKNKYSRLKGAFFDAFHSEEMGGTQGLIDWAKTNTDTRTQFYKLMVQLMPKDLNLSGADNMPIATKVEIHVVDASGEPDELVIDGVVVDEVTEDMFPDTEIKRIADASPLGGQ